MILTQNDSYLDIERLAGGKAKNLKKMQLDGAPVPEFIAITNEFLQICLKELNFYEKINQLGTSDDINREANKLLENYRFSDKEKEQLRESLEKNNLINAKLAIRSSGLDEDSKDHSFAGMFESFLFQSGLENIEKSIINCWKSAFSIRCIQYRLDNNLSIKNIGMGVVIQKMVDSDVSGVMFTRNPIDSVDRKNIIIEAVPGQCEGLVSGALEADSFKFHRDSEEIKENIIEKEFKFIQAKDGSGLEKVEIPKEIKTLNPKQIKELKDLAIRLENINKMPLDIEWAYENDKLYVVQMRPVTTLPGLAYYDAQINGDYATLWDNSNIVESFAGVTTPLTFSLTKEAYAIVYRQTCRVLKVPETIIKDYDYAFTNMLGFIRGRVYYNLINWYKLLFIVPGSSSNQGFMETMMGVKEELDDEQQELFNFVDEAPKYSAFRKFAVLGSLIWKFITIKSVTKDFRDNFDKIYTEYLEIDFQKKDLREIKRLYERWNENVTYSWKAPIINDFLVMIFFGTLKKLCEKWIKTDEETFNLQNDLLCGQGDVDSTLPTITLMQLSQKYDQDQSIQKLFLESQTEDLIQKFRENQLPQEVSDDIHLYLKNYGFRCNNEQKLEEDDLYTNPSFIFDNLRNYIKMKNYSIEKMYENERKIRDKAQGVVNAQLSGIRKLVFNWVLKHARAAVKNRENLRFLRSKSFGISRRIFRAIASHLHALDIVEQENDTFYLTYREIFDYIDGKSEFLNLKDVARIRRDEFSIYQNEQDPPDRFLSYGTSGVSLENMQIIQSGDLLKHKVRVSDDPDLFYGVSCSPGMIKGKVRVAHSIDDAKDMNGEILVTKRTDPGWVPLFPFCSGLIIERGSLLSHSAVIARELGIPTIVGVPANLLETLKTGMTVDLNATQAEVRILHED
jgi:phosphohistidine swiveling domain-containing protein